MNSVSAKFLDEVNSIRKVIDNKVLENKDNPSMHTYVFTGGSYLLLLTIADILIKIYDAIMEKK